VTEKKTDVKELGRQKGKRWEEKVAERHERERQGDTITSAI